MLTFNDLGMRGSQLLRSVFYFSRVCCGDCHIYLRQTSFLPRVSVWICCSLLLQFILLFCGEQEGPCNACPAPWGRVSSLASSSCCCAHSHPLAQGFLGLKSCASMGPQAVTDGGEKQGLKLLHLRRGKKLRQTTALHFCEGNPLLMGQDSCFRAEHVAAGKAQQKNIITFGFVFPTGFIGTFGQLDSCPCQQVEGFQLP